MSSLIFFITFFAFALWDIYFHAAGVRPLDVMGFAFALFYVVVLLAENRRFLVKKNTLVSCVVMFSILFLYCVVGVFRDLENLKPVVGVGAGLFVFFVFYGVSLKADRVVSAARFVLMANVVCFFVQLVFYYAGGRVINIYSAIGLAPRSMSSIFRPTGLYLEPASYSVSMLMMVALLHELQQKFDKLILISLITVVASISLWGMMATVVLLFFLMKDRLLIYFACLLLGVGLLFLIGSTHGVQADILNNFVLARLTNIDSDHSVMDRYGVGGENKPLDERVAGALFGQGVSNSDLLLGYNGFSFALSAFGVVGICVLLAVLWSLAGSKDKFLDKLFVIGLMLTAAPLWNTFFWWFWVALYIRAVPGKKGTAKIVMKSDISSSLV